MTLAFFIESLMMVYIPAGFITSLVGFGSIVAIPTSAIIGIPAYMNGYAAIPLISGLMELGMTPGAALSFATAGAVSSIPAALAVYTLVKRSVFFVYITLGIVGSMIAGYLYQLLNLLYRPLSPNSVAISHRTNLYVGCHVLFVSRSAFRVGT
jgi:uncharacterized membrane protein YraQ (UPF0718 family)